MGRPRLPVDKRRKKPLRIRLTDEERRLIDVGAEAAGERNTSQWARDALLRAARRQIQKSREPSKNR